jgi:hypothetical protein
MVESQVPYTRREAQASAPSILGQYHDLLMANDLAGLEKLLDVYNVAEPLREELRQEFMHYAERILRRRWRGPKSS